MIPDLLCYADKVTRALAKMVHWPNTTTPSKRSVSMESGHTQVPTHRLESNLIQVVIFFHQFPVRDMKCMEQASGMQCWINDHNKCRGTVSTKTY